MELLEIKELRSSMCVFRNHKEGLEVEYHGGFTLRPPLTKRQEAVLHYFQKFQEAHKACTPTVKRCAVALLMASKSLMNVRALWSLFCY